MHTCEMQTALLTTWAHHRYSLVGWDSEWGFENANTDVSILTVEVCKAVGTRRQRLLWVGVEVPVAHRGPTNYSLKAIINHDF